MTLRSWNELVGQQRIRGWLEIAVGQGRLNGSFLLVGPPGIGKRTLARLLAKTLLCERVPASQMQPCGVCEGCIQVDAATHPDLIVVKKPDDKNTIPLELLIGRAEARMQEGFCRDIRLRPFLGRRKVAILEDADFLNEEGANCLLKTLEEPPADSIILLIGTSEQKQLPTIRSRCRTIRFTTPGGADAVQLLRGVRGLQASDDAILEAVELAAGDIRVAADLLSGDGSEFYQTLRGQLSDTVPNPAALSRLIAEHVDAAGKEATKRRDAMRNVFSMGVQHYRSQMRHEAVQDRVAGVTLRRMDRCIRALREVDRSANQATLIECFAADIAVGDTGDRGEIG